MISPLDNKAVLLATDQAVTNAWADVGDIINTGDVEKIAIWLKLVINDSTGVLLRVVGLMNAADSDVYEIGESGTIADSDQNFVLVELLDDCFPFVKIQIMAGTAGTSAATATVNITGKRVDD